MILIVDAIISQMPTSTNINLCDMKALRLPGPPASLIGLGAGPDSNTQSSTGDQNKIKPFQLLINKTTNADMLIN